MTNRIEYIDVIKGFLTLWVVLLHSYYSDTETDVLTNWLFAPYRMPSFFFLSGIFFRQRPLKVFLQKRVNTLIVPFFVFWTVGLVYVTIKYEVIAHFVDVHYVGIGSFAEYATSLKNIFYLHPKIPAAAPNGPLWFLAALFVVQLFHYLVHKITNNKAVIVAIAVALQVASYFLDKNEITGLFYLPEMCRFYIYYAAGNLWGSDLVKLIENKRGAVKILLGCLAGIVALSLWDANDILIAKQTVLCARLFCFVPIIFIVFRTVGNYECCRPLKFFGQNSLITLVTHAFITKTMLSFFIKILPKVYSDIPSWLYCIITFLICVAAEYFVIKWCTRHIPKFVAKQDLWR